MQHIIEDAFNIEHAKNYACATPIIARYPGKIYGNISLNSGISWGLAAPRPPRGFPRVLGPWKNNFWKTWFLMIFRSVS